MTRRCFFVEDMNPELGVVRLTDRVGHHLGDVLRLKRGDAVDLRDGRGNAWRAVIAGVEGSAVRVELGEKQALRNESTLEITLALAFSQLDRMDLVLRQATEIGVQRFVAFRAQRSQYGLSGARAEKRRERWSRIIREALCQCERIILPRIEILSDVRAFIAASGAYASEDEGGLKLVAREAEPAECLTSLRRLFPACTQVVVVVGPEGGWAQTEVDQFMEAGFHAVQLGPRILRLETAAVAVLSSVQLLWGDFGA